MTQLKVINAPAGSGKSTEIRKKVHEWAASKPLDRLLCVTFTNRAADELKEQLSTDRIDVSTIHSYLYSLSVPLFASPQIVDLYFELYGKDIELRIQNGDEKSYIAASNERYRRQLGQELTLDVIAKSVDRLYYTETPFNSLLSGGLSHDDLLSFISVCAHRFPSIYKRVHQKYHKIIIDEYQDTNPEVLQFFLSAVDGTETALHLYGDRMQQIYETDMPKFRSLLSNFEIEEREVVNYRSSPAIVQVLNNIYNDRSLVQRPTKNGPSQRPKIHITSRPEDLEKNLSDHTTLTLSVYNSIIFQDIGAGGLYKHLSKHPDHNFLGRHKAAAVLAESDWEKTPNPLISLLYGLLTLEQNYFDKVYGSMIRDIRSNESMFGKIQFHAHTDKNPLQRELAGLFETMRADDVTIRQVVDTLSTLKIEKPPRVESYLQDADYAAIIDLPFVEVRRAFEYARQPNKSTQHGVKGESHQSVIFMAKKSTSTPVVHIDKLFNMWPRHDFHLNGLETFYARVFSAFEDALTEISVPVGSLDRNTFPAFEDRITASADSIYSKFQTDSLFSELYGAEYERYLSKPGVTAAKKLFNMTPIEGLLSAYRLFYVGCSRAEENLDIVVEKSTFLDLEASTRKFEQLGFDVFEEA